jgi:putative Mg2+ transporter-C (MgtC) family protein
MILRFIITMLRVSLERENMPVHIGWSEIGVRLLLSALAGGLFGLNRGEHGRPAGLRTTMLVCLAAAITMIEVNLLVDTRGKPVDSFVQLDMMRLPLGLLSGMGFIGAGAIVRKDSFVLGVTTAATLWYVTVVGLCLGGGQLALGTAGAGLGIIVLWGLKRVEKYIHRERRASLAITVTSDGPSEDELRLYLNSAGVQIQRWTCIHLNPTHCRTLECEVAWRETRTLNTAPAAFLTQLAAHGNILELEWKDASKA